jgi:hypothetical protein
MIRSISVNVLRVVWMFLLFISVWEVAKSNGTERWDPVVTAVMGLQLIGAITIWAWFRGAKAISAFCGVIGALLRGYAIWSIVDEANRMGRQWALTTQWGPLKMQGAPAVVAQCSLIGLLLVFSLVLLWVEMRGPRGPRRLYAETPR